MAACIAFHAAAAGLCWADGEPPGVTVHHCGVGWRDRCCCCFVVVVVAAAAAAAAVIGAVVAAVVVVAVVVCGVLACVTVLGTRRMPRGSYCRA